MLHCGPQRFRRVLARDVPPGRGVPAAKVATALRIIVSRKMPCQTKPCESHPRGGLKPPFRPSFCVSVGEYVQIVMKVHVRVGMQLA